MEHIADTHILSLPKDVQRLIFDLLPLRVLISSQQVCTQWNNELLSSLKKMTINDSRINGEVFAKIVSKLSPVHFKHVKLGAEAFIWDLSPLFRITHLASLDIHSSPSLSSSAFVRAVSCLTSLKSIRVSRSLITPRQALPAIVKHLPQLIELKLSYFEDDIDAADLHRVTNLTNLATLSLECKQLSLDDNFMLAVCSSLTKLESLQLNYTTCSESLSALSRLKMMTRLIIPQGYFAATTPSVLPPGLQHIEAKFSDKSIHALVSHCNHLTYLDIGPCPPPAKLTDAAFIAVMSLQNLQSLNLQFDVSDELLRSKLQCLSTVKYLGLTYNNAVCVEVFDLRKNMPNIIHIGYTTDAEPNHQGDIQTIGETLFPIIKERIENIGYGTIDQLANKVTGMLLDLDLAELNELATNHDALFGRVNEALGVLGYDTQQNIINVNNEDEEIQNLKVIILNATNQYLEEENEDVEFAEKITDIILQTTHVVSLRSTVKVDSSLRALIKDTLQTKIRQKQ